MESNEQREWFLLMLVQKPWIGLNDVKTRVGKPGGYICIRAANEVIIDRKQH